MPSSRRSSASSLSSITDEVSTPFLRSDLHSPSELVLVPDESDPRGDFDFSSDDEIVDDISAHLDRLKASPIPPLPPTLVFLYLLVPYLKLGPFLLSTSNASLAYTLPALFLFALLAAAARQIAYMLTKYIRKTDLEEVVADTFARGIGKEGRRHLLRSIVRGLTGVLRVLLATMYLRAATTVLLPLFPNELVIPSRVVLTIIFALVVLPLSLASSLASKTIVYATWAALLSYIVWFSSVTFAHARGTLAPNPEWSQAGVLWQSIAPIVFTFSSSWTLPLYAALKGSSPRLTNKKSKRYSFKSLSAASIALAVIIVLPLCFYSAHPNAPLLTQDSPRHPPHALIAASNAAALVLTIPLILITTPSLPIPTSIRRSTNIPVSKMILFVVTVAISLLSTHASAILSDILLTLSVASTFVVPAVLHIVTHHLHSPLAIVLPTASPTLPQPTGTQDELLQRKERMLQRRRLGKRLLWDVIAWALVLLVGGGGAAWTAGRLSEIW
ncbi:hypothetical protein OF83DRAFT_1050169 [Amylostereum chailletii]|nr:hypothetical protein OF83DRAFT_1050169 [Amylostereum chailletii]